MPIPRPSATEHKLIAITALPYSVQGSSEASTTALDDVAAARRLMIGAFDAKGLVHSSEEHADFTSSI
jgi:hypothetical protein